VKQKTRKQAQEKPDFIVQEIEKLKRAKLIQRLMRKALGAQMGRNAEAHVDDYVVKTREGHTFIEDRVIPSLKTGRNIRQPEKGKYQAQSR
jgi:hypothetical protein